MTLSVSKPIRIVHVLESLNMGGAETLLINLFRNIDRSKVIFDFIIHTEKECAYQKEVEKLGGKIYSINSFKGINYFTYRTEWKKLLREHREWKIIHGHKRSSATIYLKTAKREGLTTIVHSHSSSHGKGIKSIIKTITQISLRFIADYTFACSLEAGITAFGKKACKKDNFYIFNNAINCDEFIFKQTIRNKMRDELKISNKYVIGHVGRFSKEKNHKFLIDIFDQVNKLNKETILILVGNGKLQKIIKKLANDKGLSKCIFFLGKRNDVNKLMQVMDCFVFPSLFEGIPIAVIEAQATGLKCVISDVIPDEVMVSDLIDKKSLTDKAEIWAKDVLMFDNKKNREQYARIIKESGYDIRKNVKWIKKFYNNIILKN